MLTGSANTLHSIGDRVPIVSMCCRYLNSCDSCKGHPFRTHGVGGDDCSDFAGGILKEMKSFRIEGLIFFFTKSDPKRGVISPF